MPICISQIVATLRSSQAVCRTLPSPRLCLCDDGTLPLWAGNSAVVAKVTLGDDPQPYAMKCYTRKKARLAAIYREAFRVDELYVYDISGCGEWVDVVIREWIEGRTLDRVLREAVDAADGELLASLSRSFDRMAVELLRSERAHGDLKPENILLTAEGDMRLVDWDAAWLPAMEWDTAVETGTPDWQHPLRTAALYDKHIDDYSVALLSAMLAALAADCLSLAPYIDLGGRLFSPSVAVRGADEPLDRAEYLLALRGDAVHYRIARLLHSAVPQMPLLGELLSYAITPVSSSDDFAGASLAPSRTTGRWGYRRGEQWVVPPLYDVGFEPSEGLALVEIDRCRHFIAADMRSVVECSAFESVKPMRDGRAVAVRDGRRCTICRDGRVEETF